PIARAGAAAPMTCRCATASCFGDRRPAQGTEAGEAARHSVARKSCGTQARSWAGGGRAASRRFETEWLTDADRRTALSLTHRAQSGGGSLERSGRASPAQSAPCKPVSGSVKRKRESHFHTEFTLEFTLSSRHCLSFTTLGHGGPSSA